MLPQNSRYKWERSPISCGVKSLSFKYIMFLFFLGQVKWLMSRKDVELPRRHANMVDSKFLLREVSYEQLVKIQEFVGLGNQFSKLQHFGIM